MCHTDVAGGKKQFDETGADSFIRTRSTAFSTDYHIA